MKPILLVAACLLAIPALAEDNAVQFRALDLNGDGHVSLAEAAGHAEVVSKFDRADRNRDGKLSRAEFDRLKTMKIQVATRKDRNAATGGSAARADKKEKPTKGSKGGA